MSLLLIASVLLILFLSLLSLRPAWSESVSRQVARRSPPQAPASHRFHPPKPKWVRDEVVRLKALMPAAGCRRIAFTFNRLHEGRRDMTVGKSFVAGVLRESGEEVLRKRREIKHRRPRTMARNVIWGLDWTWVPHLDGKSGPVLGVIDHGSRACLELEPVESRRTVAVLRRLLELCERFGTPKVVRTDNDSAFSSLLFRGVLRLLGVRHQRTAPFAPWQNGRIERLFRTVKEVLRERAARTGSDGVSHQDLGLVRTWYNHLRPHQHLDGATPAEVWSRKRPSRKRRPRWVSGWEGLLAGCYWPD